MTSNLRYGSLLVAVGCLSAAAVFGADFRLGIIGCDTSHATEFTETLNNPEAKGHMAGVKVVAAFKGGSKDIPESADRVEEYSKTLQKKYGVKFYDSIADMCRDVDGVLLESIDGRPHLEQVKPVFAAHKPVFVDKPMAGSLREVIEIFKLAKAAGVPVFSSSSLRFAKTTQAVHNGALGRVSYAETYGPCYLEPHHPTLFWYGVHGVEALYTVMGPGCESVQRGTTPDGKIEVVGLWSGGRKGVFRAADDFRGVARGEKGEAKVGDFDGYVPLIVEIVKFFQTGVAPVQPEETMEIFAFMEAADQSAGKAGAPIMIADVLKQAGQ
jgi:predicted dehydrogenase